MKISEIILAKSMTMSARRVIYIVLVMVLSTIILYVNIYGYIDTEQILRILEPDPDRTVDPSFQDSITNYKLYNLTTFKSLYGDDGNKLPLIQISPRSWIRHKAKWRNYNLPLFTSMPAGRLGNQMGEYATLYALSKIYNVSVVLHPEMDRLLRDKFPHLSIETLEGPYTNSEWRPVSHLGKLYNYGIVEVAAAGLLGASRFVITDTPFEIQLFNAFREEIKQEFQFNDQTKSVVSDMLIAATRQWYQNNTSNTNLTYVGVHIRRTDYKNHMMKLFGGHLPGMTYFQAAMNYYKKKYQNVLFVIASDDPKYISDIFQHHSDVYISRGLTPIQDIALLNSCNHSIITLGSFGFWTAYLTGGEVVYPEISVNMIYRFSRPIYEESGLKNFIPIKVF